MREPISGKTCDSLTLSSLLLTRGVRTGMGITSASFSQTQDPEDGLSDVESAWNHLFFKASGCRNGNGRLGDTQVFPSMSGFQESGSELRREATASRRFLEHDNPFSICQKGCERVT